MHVIEHGLVRRINVVTSVLACAYALVLAVSFAQSSGWLIGEHGGPRAIEFTGVRAAGVLALAGKPAAAYDWIAHHVMQDTITGRSDGIYHPWGYPPHFLFVAMLLALLPYATSALVWIGVTLFGYGFVGSRLVGMRAAGLWVAALPSSFINIMVAHTGFLTGGLFGGALLALPKQPLLAGCIFGCLTIKPQLGILIPVALVAGGYWRTLIAAAVTAGLLVSASCVVFGFEPWLALGPQMARVADTIRGARVDMTMLVTPYGFMRSLGAGDISAAALQSAVSLMLAVAIYRLWRTDASADLKSAALISASLLVTPYLFIYDLTLLAFVAAFVWRDAGADGLNGQEIAAFGGAMILLMLFANLPFSAGFVANVLCGVIVACRAWPFLALGRRGQPSLTGIG